MAKRPGNYRHVNESQARQHEALCFDLRARGRTIGAIAREVNLSRQAVRKILDRANDRELEALSEKHRHLKITQNSQLETLIEEGFDGWFKSKEMGHRVRQTTNAEGEEVTVTEVIDREGTVAFIDRIRGLLSDQRALWGLNVADQAHEEFMTVAQATEKMAERAKAYEQRIDAEDPGWRDRRTADRRRGSGMAGPSEGSGAGAGEGSAAGAGRGGAVSRPLPEAAASRPDLKEMLADTLRQLNDASWSPGRGYRRIYFATLWMLADGATPEDVRRCMRIGRVNGDASYHRENPGSSIDNEWSREHVDSVAVRSMEDALAGRDPNPWPEDP